MSIFHIERNPTRRQLRQFGAIGAVLLVLLAWWQRESAVSAAAVGLLGIIMLIGAVRSPRLLRRPFVWLSALLYPVGLVVGEVVLAATYFLIITPVAIVFRLLRRDALNRSLDPDSETYWQEPKRPQGPLSYFRQY